MSETKAFTFISPLRTNLFFYSQTNGINRRCQNFFFALFCSVRYDATKNPDQAALFDRLSGWGANIDRDPCIYW